MNHRTLLLGTLAAVLAASGAEANLIRFDFNDMAYNSTSNPGSNTAVQTYITGKLAGTGITNTGSTTITGDVGTFPTATITTVLTGCGSRPAPALFHPAAQHGIAQAKFLGHRSDRAATRSDQIDRLPLVVVRKRPTLTSFHPTPPGSPSLLQVSTHSEEVH